MEMFKRWLMTAKSGDRFVYHVGFLADDSERDWRVRAYAEAVAVEARAGMVHLTQKRLGPFKYAYRATRSKKTRRQLTRQGGNEDGD